MANVKTGPSIAVDRGQPVIVTVHFGDGDPDDVYFSYTKPGSDRPFVDDGYGQARSRIEHVGDGIYRYVIPTKGFPSGEGVWHFSGEWKAPRSDGYDEASIFGTYFVNDNPAQLL